MATKECVVCNAEFETKYSNTKFCGDVCRKENHRIKAHKYYTPRTPKSYTKDCQLCGVTFTTGNVKNSHQIKYCHSDCKSAVALERNNKAHKVWAKTEHGLKRKRANYHKNKKLKGPQELVCITCGTSFTSRRNEKGYGGEAKYCNLQCYPHKVKAKQLREKKRKEGKHCQWCGDYICFKDADHQRLKVYDAVKFCSSKCVTANRMSNPMNRLSARFRSLISTYNLKRRSRKSAKSFETLGYTPLELMLHIESQFTEENGYSWDNMDEWHIDHIRPVASFNYDSTEHPDFKKCWALNNLQPLWAADNISKGDKWDGVVNA